MTLDVLAWTALLLAGIPAVLTCWNLSILLSPRRASAGMRRVSVLIPARNEAGNIGAAIDAVLADRSAEIELIVLDDDSVDATAAVVRDRAHRDPRIRLISRKGPPPGVCGKPHACQQLADAATSDTLVFVDADVRIRSAAVFALVAALDDSGAAMISGIPYQHTASIGERMLIPLMHFVLYGYLPVAFMRATRHPSYGAACGQLIAVNAAAYELVGGHAAIATQAHDGIALARRFRTCGYGTDLIDATHIATCRMYSGWSELVEGLAKNAHEGLGSPAGIVPWTLLLGAGHVLPYLLLPFVWTSPVLSAIVLAAILLALSTRALLALRFRQSWLGVVLHPAGVAALILIQWYALYRRAVRRPVTWKGRRLPSS
ncbi:MAG TPA: glycosyltransferase family 2 protein [Gammaproteobacteria bacterium]|nr:glycosyltransferase family 2 protein [Gammaproteobacteria bacterium]